MLEGFACPCCDATSWEPQERHLYTADGGGGTSAEVARREFFFSAWRPGEDQTILQELLCTRCGLLTYSPRPSAEDIREKYATLLRWGIQPGAPSDACFHDERASKLADSLIPHLPRSGARVLDVGGGDGRLLRDLAEQGVGCAVVDYNQQTVPGVSKLGDTIDDIADGERFDAIVLSHVLEHVSSPRDLVTGVGRLLSPGGVVFAEVPVEIWRGTPVASDPLTHVNHFVGAALRALFRCNGYRILKSFEGTGTYDGRPLVVSSVIATPGYERSGEDPAAAVRHRLSPTWMGRIRTKLGAVISRCLGSVRWLTHERPFARRRAGYERPKTPNEGDTPMPTTQTVKRRTAATKRSTTAKKAAGTRARKTAATNASRAKTSVKRTVNRPKSSAASKQVRPLAAQAEFVGAVVTNTVQTVVTGGTKVVAGAAKRVANFL